MSKFITIDQLPRLDGVKYKEVVTGPLEKFGASFFNVIIALGLSVPFLLLWGPGLSWKISVIVLFAFYESFIFLKQKDRCFGMKIMDTYWEKKYKFKQHLIYNILYTLSFSTVLIHIWFPLDLLLINIFLIQLPTVLLTGTTFHGYLSKMETVKIIPKIK